ncbi:MAG: ABC transporter substrate-binding protein, partial [Firmicutes bacterium]|nr:ABC transporter substrate-binding protein [Bacillota bacterium]
NKIYLPLRFILETLNYNIKWDSKNNKVIIKKQEKITYPIKVKNGNEEYIIKKEPEKIVSLAPGVTEKLYALGVLDKVKGRTQYCNYPKEVKNITNIGSLYEPNLETIIDINPDIVIGETHFKEKHLNKLNSAGINTVAKSTATDIEGVYEYMIELGAIVNRNYEARALVSSLKSKATRAEYILKDIKENEKPSVYYVVGTGQSGEYTAGGNTFISSLINLAGGKNIAKDIDGWSYSIEKLVDNDPDIIFGAKYNINTMVNGENYQSLSAIRKNKYYTFDKNIIERAAPRAINQGLKELIEIFHNDKVDKLNF